MNAQAHKWPSARLAERAVIGCMMLAPESIEPVVSTLYEAKLPFWEKEPYKRLFSERANAVVMEEIAAMIQDGFADIDPVILCERLEAKGLLIEAGGPARIMEHEAAVLFSASATAYAETVVDAARRRQTKAIADNLASELEIDADTATKRALAELKRIVETTRGQKSLSPDAAHERLATTLAQRTEAIHGTIPSPWSQYNYLRGGFRPRDLVCFAGAYHSGKSSLGICTALGVAHYLFRQNIPGLVVFIGMEEPEETLQLMAVSCFAAIDTAAWHETPIQDAIAREAESIYSAHLKPLPLILASRPALSLSELESMLRALSRERLAPIRLVIVDYIQKLSMPAAQPGHKINEEAGHRKNINDLADLAHNGDIDGNPCFIALVQEDFNPRSTGAEQKRINEAQAGNARFCRAIYGAADAYAVLTNKGQFSREEAAQPTVNATLALKKSRQGKIGDVKLIFQKPYARFEERVI